MQEKFQAKFFFSNSKEMSNLDTLDVVNFSNENNCLVLENSRFSLILKKKGLPIDIRIKGRYDWAPQLIHGKYLESREININVFSILQEAKYILNKIGYNVETLKLSNLHMAIDTINGFIDKYSYPKELALDIANTCRNEINRINNIVQFFITLDPYRIKYCHLNNDLSCKGREGNLSTSEIHNDMKAYKKRDKNFKKHIISRWKEISSIDFVSNQNLAGICFVLSCFHEKLLEYKNYLVGMINMCEVTSDLLFYNNNFKLRHDFFKKQNGNISVPINSFLGIFAKFYDGTHVKEASVICFKKIHNNRRYDWDLIFE